ncbi:MAG: cupin domain-containing protein [Planctomycetes bacterium]|nr:cupin domain-containing protein [Planctomycetota bacterium]
MKVQKADDVVARAVNVEGARNVTIRVLIGPDDGAPTFNMRQFTLAPGGCTPRHQHEWEHEVYILAGEGTVLTPQGDKPIAAGDCIFVPGDELHRFTNTADGELKFLCLVPRTATF